MLSQRYRRSLTQLQRRDGLPRREAFLRRKGTTTVEFAMVSPVVFLIVFGAIMLFGALTTQNTLAAAARAGGRVASPTSVTSSAIVIAAVQQRLQQGGVDVESVTVNVSPTDLSNLKTGDEVSISVSMPLNKSTWLQFGDFLSDNDMAAQMTFLRE